MPVGSPNDAGAEPPHLSGAFYGSPHVSATVDVLTGIHNRASFLSKCEVALSESGRRRRPASLLYIELDRFQQINETMGCSLTAMVLKELVSRVNIVRSPNDVLGRTHPERLALFASGRTGPEAMALASKLHRLVGLLTVGSSLAFRRLTVSIGLASSASASCRISSLTDQANHALEVAKAKGSGRIVYRALP